MPMDGSAKPHSPSASKTRTTWLPLTRQPAFLSWLSKQEAHSLVVPASNGQQQRGDTCAHAGQVRQQWDVVRLNFVQTEA